MGRTCTTPFLHYRGGMDLYNIIGGPRPHRSSSRLITILRYVRERVQFGQYKPFGDEFRHLHERNKEFVRFYHRLARATAQQGNADEAYNYVDACKKLRADARNYVRSGGHDVDYWNTQRFFETPSKIYSLGTELRYRTHNIKMMARQSDVLIAPSESYRPSKDESLHLVLPCNPFHEPLRYGEDRWDSQTGVPISDSQGLHQRTLLGNGSVYPYLTMDDFLEKRLMGIDSKLDRNLFFNGNRAKEDNYSYSPPLTPLFFRSLSVDDLINMRPDGPPMPEMEDLHGNVIKAPLRIPINKKGSSSPTLVSTASIPIDEFGGESVEKNFTLGISPPPHTHFDNNRGEIEITPILPASACQNGRQARRSAAERIGGLAKWGAWPNKT